MYEIEKEIQFDAGHRVPLHASKCHNPHGHRYRVVATVVGELITDGPESGMVRDFSIVKHYLTTLVHDKYDHAFIIHEDDEGLIRLFQWNEWKHVIVPFYPTAECLAKDIFDDLSEHLDNILCVEVWETPTSVARYYPEES